MDNVTSLFAVGNWTELIKDEFIETTPAVTGQGRIIAATYDRLEKFSLGYSLLLGLSVVIAMVAVCVNCVVISSLRKVPTKTLRSKLLVMSTLISDTIFPLVSLVEVFMFIIFAYGIRDGHTMTCWEVFGNSLSILTQFSQLLSSLTLAIDRAYAIVAPMTYYLLGYHKRVTALILFCTWLGPWTAYVVYVIARTVLPPKIPEGICYKLIYVTSSIPNSVRFPMAISLVATTFTVYVGVFATLKLGRKSNKAVSSIKSETQKDKISFVITFFLILLTTATLYLLAPLIKNLVQWIPDNPLSRVDTTIFLKSLINVYYLNAIIDPIIFASRIPSIKKQLPAFLRNWVCIAGRPHKCTIGSNLSGVTHLNVT